MKVVTLGPIGTFSHEVAKGHFKKAKLLFFNTIDQVFEAVDKGKADRGLVPLENSDSGIIPLTISQLMNHSLFVVDAIHKNVAYHLAGMGGNAEITLLFVHPQTFQQCHRHIEQWCPKAEIVYTPSNAASAQKLLEAKSPKVAAVVPSLAVELYALSVIAANIQDDPENSTRFLVISRKPQRKGSRTMAFLFSEVEEGALYALLEERKLPALVMRRLVLKNLECPTYLVEYEGNPVGLSDLQTKLLGCY